MEVNLEGTIGKRSWVANLPALLLTAISVFAASSGASAAVVAYTDRTLFQDALSSFSTDNLDGVLGGTSLVHTRGDFVFSAPTGIGAYGCINHAGCGDNSPLGFDDAYLWTYLQDAYTFAFNTPVHGLGFDYSSPIAYSPVGIPVLEGLSPVTSPGFFGVISDTPLTSFTFDQTGSYLLIDNITYGASGPLPPATYTVGGAVTGLTGAGLELLNNGGDTLPVAALATSFTFVTELADAADYAVTVSTQPTGQTCAVTNGSGTIATADVSDVNVACVDDVAPPPAEPPKPVPTMSAYGLVLTMLGLMFVATRRLRASAKRD